MIEANTHHPHHPHQRGKDNPICIDSVIVHKFNNISLILQIEFSQVFIWLIIMIHHYDALLIFVQCTRIP